MFWDFWGPVLGVRSAPFNLITEPLQSQRHASGLCLLLEVLNYQPMTQERKAKTMMEGREMKSRMEGGMDEKDEEAGVRSLQVDTPQVSR